MKLRNKKTGEIKDFALVIANGSIDDVTLAELNEEWEDYEEQKAVWYLDSQGDIQKWRDTECDEWTEEKQVGNYFETEEEAEKAVEKLKAWKRLKDKGFEFNGWCDRGDEPIGEMRFRMPKIGQEWPEDEIADLDLLFGGENE